MRPDRAGTVAAGVRFSVHLNVRAEIRIGASGYHYKHWRGPFYPERLAQIKMFEFYAARFDTVELNTTFYRLPPKTAVREWRENSPAGFLFAAKGSRFITHMKKLKDPVPALDRYFDHIGGLSEKLGPIVFQLPPFWHTDLERLRDFLAALPTGRRYSFEFRDPTWHRDDVYAVLEQHNAAFCSFDIAGFQSPVLLTADFAYVRLHGPGPGPYQGSYSRPTLEQWAERVRTWASRLKSVYIYFDNDASAFAVENAIQLRALTGS